MTRSDRLAIVARNLVGHREPAALTAEVAIGLRDALDAAIVLVLGRGGRILATAGLGETDPPLEVSQPTQTEWSRRAPFGNWNSTTASS